MRISTDFNPFRFFLVGILLAAQFGCASVQKPPYYYNPSDKVDAVIERPNASSCTPNQFDTKLDEVRKKTKLFVPTGPVFDSLIIAVNVISGTTQGVYKRVEGYQRKSALICGVLAGVVCLVYVLSWDVPIMDEAYLVRASPFIALIGGGIGALAGSLVGGAFAVKKLREPLPVEKVRPLDSLVVRYNTYIAEQGEAQP